MPLPPVRHRIERLLAHADVRVDGNRPWDLQLRDERFFARVLLQGSLGLGESYMDGWWETGSLDGLVHRLLAAQVDERARGLGDLVDALRAHLQNLQSERRIPFNEEGIFRRYPELDIP